MQCDMLNTKEVIAGGKTARDLDIDGLQAAGRPGEAGAGDGGVLLVDLEPDGTVAVERLSRLSRGGLGHVELQGARVLDAAVDAESHGVAGVDVLGPGAIGAGRQLVAADLLVAHILHGAVRIVVRCLADEGPVCLGHTVVY